MLLYGDEMRRTAEGDNNTVFQDNELNWINWDDARRHHEILRFTQHLIAFRKRHQIVRRWRYMTPDESETPILRHINWHGVKPFQADFSSTSRFIAYTLEAFATGERSDVPIYVACNASWEPIEVELPHPEGEGTKRWYRVVDTHRPEGEDIVPDEQAIFLGNAHFELGPRSAMVLIAK
jgi:glycogen operon protein